MTTAPEPLLAPITLDHIALQAELLVIELRNIRMDPQLEQAEIDQLHRMVANALLFLDSGADRPRPVDGLQPDDHTSTTQRRP